MFLLESDEIWFSFCCSVFVCGSIPAFLSGCFFFRVFFPFPTIRVNLFDVITPPNSFGRIRRGVCEWVPRLSSLGSWFCCRGRRRRVGAAPLKSKSSAFKCNGVWVDFLYCYESVEGVSVTFIITVAEGQCLPKNLCPKICVTVFWIKCFILPTSSYRNQESIFAVCFSLAKV